MALLARGGWMAGGFKSPLSRAVAVALGVVLVLAGAWRLQESIQANAQAAFDSDVARLQEALQARFAVALRALTGARGFVVARTPLGRLGTVEDIARGICFLASDQAGFISAQTLAVDGGVTFTNL